MASRRSKHKQSRFFRNLKKNKTMRLLTIASILVVLGAVGFFIYTDRASREKYEVSYTAGNTDGGDLEYGGKMYRQDDRITHILLIGVDSTGEMVTSSDYGDQARADNIMLVSLHRQEMTVKLLPISRDTMTEVTKYSATGYNVGTTFTHLGFAYSFGDGGNASSMNVCNAVSELLYGVGVYRYVTTNMDSIPYVNDLIGGVTVEVPNDDLAHLYPEMVTGNMVEMTEENVTDFLRYRDTSVNGSNNGRMERQQAYMRAYVEKLQTLSEDDYRDIWNKLDDEDSKIKTNITRNAFLNLLGECRDYDYDADVDNLKIEGTNSIEDGYDVFYPDKDKLRKLVVENYCREVE